MDLAVATAGIALGLVIGVITGIVTLLLIRTAWNTPPRNVKKMLALTAEFLGIPAFWFGGTWATSSVLKDVNLSAILPYYVAALACTFVPICIYPLAKMVASIAASITRRNGDPNA
jgi:hypothetical protein